MHRCNLGCANIRFCKKAGCRPRFSCVFGIPDLGSDAPPRGSLATARRSAPLNEAVVTQRLAPAVQRRAVERQLVPEHRFSAEILEIRVLYPPVAPRYRVSIAATIKFVGGGPIDCVVRNLSVTRAAIEVPNQAGIPDSFLLVIPDDGLRLPCHIAWRTDYRIGIAFD